MLVTSKCRHKMIERNILITQIAAFSDIIYTSFHDYNRTLGNNVIVKYLKHLVTIKPFSYYLNHCHEFLQRLHVYAWCDIMPLSSHENLFMTTLSDGYYCLVILNVTNMHTYQFL